MATQALFGGPTRHEADPDRVAVILPGAGYTAARPLLHYARAVLAHHDWSVQEVWWTHPHELDWAETIAWVGEQARRALDAETAARPLLVGKSLGSLAAPVAADRGLPAIWLTPLLSRPEVREALGRATAPTLLVGGTADGTWHGDAARALGHPYVEVTGADHGLEQPDDPLKSVENLGVVTAGMSEFLAGLGRTRAR